MAKRHAESTVHELSPKKHRPLFHSVDVQVDSMASVGGVPSLLALLGNRCKKRPHCFEEPELTGGKETGFCLRTAVCHPRKHVANVLTESISGSFQDSRSACALTNKKRPRRECVGLEEAITQDKNKTVDITENEDCSYNSFQFWRVPLPELDLSLLDDDPRADSQTKEKSKSSDSSSDAMES
ncbi:hypothetical protein FQA47_014354 [Oryzias melastigma]|uniref:Putative WW-binding domain-containing protein n=1 Tax=Oryzias melastigma TaxID=30732 RepID=A0A834F307_ORYME|nr:hypothetical protein FQA47_014354 [Oryzias melastigma]